MRRARRFRDLPYRSKLFVTILLTVVIVVAAATAITSVIASGRVTVSNGETLQLLTEQALYNFSNTADAMGKNIYALYSGTHTAEQMNLMRNIPQDDIRYMMMRRDLTMAVARMITASGPYDHASVLLTNGDIVTGNPLNEAATGEAERILSMEEYSSNTYGACMWLRTDSGSLWCIRDVYCLSPLRRVGKMAVRLRQDKLVSIGRQNDHYPCSIIFFDSANEWLMTSGNAVDGDVARAAAALLIKPSGTLTCGRDQYAVTVQSRNGWQAVGLLPISIVRDMRLSIIRGGLLAALVGAMIGLILALRISGRMTAQLSRLVQSMEKVSDGDLDVMIPVESSDEIGVLTDNFNQMTRNTKQLVQKLIEEEKHKQQAEYQNLEYKYRFLQWQINPHFIYNALETVNAHAKIDRNAELSGMIVQLSAYFRTNAQSMEKKYITVEEEFRSIEQYVSIYKYIYGPAMRLVMRISPDAEQALVPTMILQPIMENALIHGADSADDSEIVAEAEICGDTLAIRIRDNGPGIPDEVIRDLLADAQEEQGDVQTSLGLRNVRERLRLLYGDQAGMDIGSGSEGGTCVTLTIPCRFNPSSAKAADST